MPEAAAIPRAHRSVDTLRFVLGDQLSPNLSSLRDINPEIDVVLMVEVADECTYVRHHVKKIAFVLSAMRHFAEALRARGIVVDYGLCSERVKLTGFCSA